MKQTSFIPITKRTLEHGGSLLLGRRRKRRPLSLKCSHHLVLRSDFAYGKRRLTRHRPLIHRIIRKAKLRFGIKVYEIGIVSNHIHLLVSGKTRAGLQNFFRVVAGHIAQEILRDIPIRKGELPVRDRRLAGGAPVSSRKSAALHGKAPPKTRENENKFWQVRIYSRIVSWGRDFAAVRKYVVQNAMEGLKLVAYKTRRTTTRRDSKKRENTS